VVRLSSGRENRLNKFYLYFIILLYIIIIVYYIYLVEFPYKISRERHHVAVHRSSRCSAVLRRS